MGSAKWLLAAALGAALALAWLHAYSLLASKTGLSLLTPQWRVMRFRFIPVLSDPGSLVEVSGAITMAALPFYLAARRGARTRELMEQQVGELLSLYASLLASSGSAAEALLAAASMIDPPLRVHVERMARIYKATGDLEKAFREAFRDAPRSVRIYAYNIVAATQTRGMMHRVLGTAASYAQSSRRLMSLVRSRLSEYGFIAALAAITFAFSSGIVVGLVAKLSTMSMPGFGQTVNPDFLLGLYYYSLLAMIFASSVIMSRVVQGYTPLAAKYIVMLTLPNTLIMLLAPKIMSLG